ncbi:hypothetical protein K504DRAFT_485898 [Pleomassaria siparia CBS 279.74]|uniref:SAC domain-containing protein n=1 Tax=Pleomassaria siparia CBS 279.74 TaxID=1314801 RepID=A0A6G1JSN9_9PLEO|nr:hypothetical protein K504DRAFT_485898 [Pleomassaria siparia CBS 279.74]
MHNSPEVRRKPNKSTSQSTNASVVLTPSLRSSTSSADRLPMIDGADTYEMRPLSGSGDAIPRSDALDAPYEDASLLPSPRRSSMSSTQSYELYTPDEDRAVLKKLDRRLVSFMAVLYCLSFLDRSNIGNARIAGLTDDLKLSSKQYEWLLWAFYITYILFEWMTLMYRVIPPHIYISICIMSWGIIASLQAVANSFGFLLILRALLGVGEAAFGPGVPFYLSFFFRRHELAFRTGLFISASPLSASFAGLLAWIITSLGKHGPLSPWRLLFLIEGFPSVLIAVWAWDYIPDGPGSAKWLSPRQQKVAVLRLRQEKEEHTREKYGVASNHRKSVNFREVLQTLQDPKCYLTAFMFFSCNVAFSSMPVFLPTIIKDMGYTAVSAQAISAPPYFFAFLVVITTAYLSDRFQSRSNFIILHSFLATAGYATIAISGYYKSPGTTVRYLALYPATAGFFSAITIIITWTINNQDSDSKKGTGMAMLNVIGQMGPLVGTSIFPREDGPWYVRGMGICACFMFLVGVLAAVLRIVLRVQNKRIRRGTEQKDQYAGIPSLEPDQPLCESIKMDGPKSRPEMGERVSSIPDSLTAPEQQDSTRGQSPAESTKSSIHISSPELTPLTETSANENFRRDFDVEKLTGVPREESESITFGGEEPDSFQRSTSPAAMQKNKSAEYDKVGDEGMNRMHKFSLYETSTRFYLVGADNMDRCFRVLKIDRTAPPGHLSIFEDDIVYDKREMDQLLNAIDDGNKATGGLRLKCSTWGLLGFIRFTEAYYMLLITKRAQVAMVGGHYIYQVDGTELIPLTTGSTSRFAKDRNPEEARFLGILNNIDLTRSFYFSYAYNITRSLQQNIIRERTALNEGKQNSAPDFQDMFVWNHHLLKPARSALKNIYDWCHPIIHGYIDQSSLDVFGRRVYITIIARRSRYFAGARFLKRGTNDLGYVANDVESEQILSEALTTSFHAPGPRLYANPTYTSYIQHRGSIPLYWTQDNTGVTPKPDIDLNLIDPFYSSAALHFDNLFERYGAPIYVLNLIKARERMPRESKLLYEYQNAIKYLNQSLPADKKIIYEAFDMARASKTRGHDVIGTLEYLAEKVMMKTGFFHNGDSDFDTPQVQSGVARTNCIDCLDRTNACQFVIGKRALGRQLHALGVIAGNTVDYDTDCVDIFTHMFHGHGDAIAIQYGGSHLVNTMATYRKINHWQSSSRDMVESFKRYYHNSFLDSQRQEAYNLFLGNYTFEHGEPLLWDLSTDYYLHHEAPRTHFDRSRRSYIDWYTPEFLESRTFPPSISPSLRQLQLTQVGTSSFDDYWLEYYRPLAISSFRKIFAFRLACPPQMALDKSFPSRKDKPSPFIMRKKQQDHESPGKNLKKAIRKEVTIVDPSSETDSQGNRMANQRPRHPRLHIPENAHSPIKQSILRDTHFEPFGVYRNDFGPSLSNSSSTNATMRPFRPADKSLMNQWTLAQFHDNSINPSVSSAEENEYVRYIEHPLNLPLVVSTDTPSADDPAALEFHEYLCMSEGGIGNIQPASEPPHHHTSAHVSRDNDASSIRSIHPTSSAGIPFSHYYFQRPDSPPVHVSSGSKFQTAEEDIEEFEEFLRVRENPLDVEHDDGSRKRYKAYRQWLKGKSFFKQSKVDPEWQNQLPMR